MDASAWTVKVFFADGAAPPPRDVIPVFHRWIQEHVLDELLIDVADYSHVHQGPGVLLVCNDAQYSIDQEEGRPGLLYAKKRGSAHETVEGRIRDAVARALRASRALEQEPTLSGRATFRTDHVVIGVADRLVAPNTPATFDALGPVIERVARAAFDDPAARVEHLRDPKATFRVRAIASRIDLGEALARLG